MRIVPIIFLLIAFSPLSIFSQSHAGTLDEIKQSGKIRIGFREAEPPMSFLGGNGGPIGYSIDVCKRIVTGVTEAVGRDVEIEYVSVNANNRFTAIRDNKIDILCGSTTKTLSRRKLVDFSQLTFVTGASFMTLKGNEFSELATLNGKKVGVVRDTTTLHTLEKLFKETLINAEIVKFNSARDGLISLQEGEIAAFSSDQVVLIGLIITAENKDAYSIAPQVFSFEPFALALRRNDADFRLVVDSVLSKLYRTQQILNIYDKWFGGFSEKRPPLHDALYQLNSTPE